MVLFAFAFAHAQTVVFTGEVRTGLPKPLVFEQVVVIGEVPEPLVEILPVRQDVTTRATVPVAAAPLLSKIEAAVGAPAF